MTCSTARLVVPGQPVAKPRQTRRDRWAQRPCVLAYRAWADNARLAARGCDVARYQRVDAVAYLEMPASWSQRRKAAAAGEPCRSKPDADNLAKALLDALWPGCDAQVHDVRLRKRWDDGLGARVEVDLFE